MRNRRVNVGTIASANRACEEDAAWLARTLTRESHALGSAIMLQ